jgi:hypothetical protein
MVQVRILMTVRSWKRCCSYRGHMSRRSRTLSPACAWETGRVQYAHLRGLLSSRNLLASSVAAHGCERLAPQVQSMQVSNTARKT